MTLDDIVFLVECAGAGGLIGLGAKLGLAATRFFKTTEYKRKKPITPESIELTPSELDKFEPAPKTKLLPLTTYIIKCVCGFRIELPATLKRPKRCPSCKGYSIKLIRVLYHR